MKTRLNNERPAAQCAIDADKASILNNTTLLGVTGTLGGESNTDRELVVLEQADTHQSDTTTTFRGCTAWTSIPGDDNRWMGCDFRQNASGSASSDVGMQLWEQFQCEFREGTINTKNSLGDSAFPDGAWSWAATNGWTRAANVASRRWVYTPKTGEKYVYVLGTSVGGAGTAAVAVAGSGIVADQASLDCGAAGDWPGVPTIIGESSGGWVKVATIAAGGDGSQTVTITPADDGSFRIIAIMSCNDTQSTPAAGVYYPPSMKRIQKSLQIALAPRYFKKAAGGAGFWMDDAHFDATHLPVSETHVVNVGDGTAATLTNNARTITSTTNVTLKWDCTLRVVDGGNQDVATHQQVIEVSPGGIVTISQRTVITAAGEAYDLRIFADASYSGGYCGQMGVHSNFSLARVRDGAWTSSVSPWDNSAICAADAVEWEMHDADDMMISLTATGTVLSGGAMHTSPAGKIIKRNEGFSKVYRQLCDTAVDLAEGDVIITRAVRRAQVRASDVKAFW